MGIEALKEQARGHEQAEEWEKALNLYSQAIERQSDDEHADLGLFNRAGDLSTRLGNLEGALAHYEQAVKLYLESELPNNAIAILKKILRNMPYRTDVYLQMGQIRAAQGFLVDARENFLKYAEIMQQEDNLPEALRALTEFAGLAQDDVDIQLMVASQLHANERTEDAVQLLVDSYAHHLRIGKSEGMDTLSGRIHEIDPTTTLPTEVDSYDAFETTSLAGDEIGGGSEGTDTSVMSDGLEIESTHLGNIDDQLAASGESDELGLEAQLASQIGQDEAGAGDAGAGGGAQAADAWGLETATEVETVSMGSDDFTFGEGLDLDAGTVDGGRSDLDLDAGLVDTERVALDLDAVLADNDAAAVEPEANTLEVDAPVDLEAAALELASLADADEPDLDAAFSAPDVEAPEDAPTFELETERDEIDLSSETPAQDGAELAEVADAVSLEVDTDDAWGMDLEAAPDAQEEFEGADLSSSWLSMEPEDEDPGAEPLEAASDLTREAEGISQAEPVEEAVAASPSLTLDDEPGFEAEDDSEPLEAAGLEDAWLTVDGVDEEASAIASEASEAAPPTPDWQSDASEETAAAAVSGDWIGPQDPTDAAPIDDPETWLHLASQFQQEGDRDQARTALVEAHLGFSERLDFQKASVAVASLIALEPESAEHHRRRIEYLEHAGDQPARVAAHLEFARLLTEQGEKGEARVQYEKVLDIDPSNQLAQSHLDEMVEPEIESGYIDLGSMVIDRVEKTTRWTVEAEEPVDEEDFDFRQMLSQFKQKVAEHVDVGDVRAHYDLGTAYREMGLMDEAISEFQLALRADSKNLATYEMLGQCFMEKGQPDFAVRSLGKAANLPHDVEDELLGIYYYLGRAHEELGQRDEAVEFYEKVFALDINFQDVTERLRSLR